MPLPEWPVSVTNKVSPDWGMPEPYIAPLTTEMDGGNKRMRSKPGSNVATVEYTVMMTRAEYVTLFEWIRTTLNNGTSRFIMQVWLGSGYQSKTVQFASPPAPRAVDHFISVPLKLTVYGV